MENVVKYNVSKLKQFAILQGEGKVTLKVRSVGEYHNPNLADVSDTYERSYIINFEAIEGRKMTQVASAIKGKETIDADELKNLLFTHEVIVNKGREVNLPLKGEKVTALLSYAINKEGEYVLDTNEEQILNVSAMIVPKAVTTKSLADFMEEPLEAGSILKEEKETIKA
jgi:hypothetical protein